MRDLTPQSRAALRMVSRIYLTPFAVMLASFIFLAAGNSRLFSTNGAHTIFSGLTVAHGVMSVALPFLFLYALHRQSSGGQHYLDLSLPVRRTHSSVYITTWTVLFATIYMTAFFLFMNIGVETEYLRKFPFFRGYASLILLLGAAAFGRGIATTVNRLKLLIGVSVVLTVYFMHYSLQSRLLPFLLPQSLIDSSFSPWPTMNSDQTGMLIRVETLTIIQIARAFINLSTGIVMLGAGIALESRREV